MNPTEELYQIVDELRAVASMGLLFSESGYEKERCERVLKAGARLASLVENSASDDIFQRFLGNLYHISPVIGVEAAVSREGKLLLIQRKDDQLWALPGGVAEVGETLAEAAARELWEEAGMHGKAARLLGLFDSRLWKNRSKVHLVNVIFQVETTEMPLVDFTSKDEFSSHSEVLDAGFFTQDELPALSQGHHVRIPVVFQLLRGEISPPYFDQTE